MSAVRLNPWSGVATCLDAFKKVCRCGDALKREGEVQIDSQLRQVSGSHGLYKQTLRFFDGDRCLF